MALTRPNNFETTNKWHIGNKYSLFINNVVKPYLVNSNSTPPYYQGSYTIKTTTKQNKANNFNLSNQPDGLGISSTANVNLASPLPKPGPAGTKLSELTPEEYRTAEIRKPINFGKETTIQKIGAIIPIGTTLNDDTISSLDRIVSNHTNATDATALGSIGAAAGAGLASNLGIPTLGQGLGAVAGGLLPPTYASVPFLNLGKLPELGGMTQDFRSRKGFGSVSDFVGKRIDGTAAAADTNNSKKNRAIAYAAASIAPGGAYTLFNRETLYGEGTPGSPLALRNDFTAKSTVTTKWKKSTDGKGEWTPTQNPLHKATEFRGDKVNVIDFRKGSYDDIYRWKRKKSQSSEKIGAVLGAIINDPGVTQDYIKFFFTGPNIEFNKTGEDDIMTFRASITSLTDTFNPQWNPVQMIGRADPNYHYSGYGRDMNLDFTIYATDRDELKPIWRKLNALASYTAPEYTKDSIAMKGPWMRITIGDLYKQTPVFISSLFYTLIDTDTTWDINIEQDTTRMQVPNKIQVSMGLTVITDYLPEKGGRMYSLNNEPGKDDQGDANWLSDAVNSGPKYKVEVGELKKED